MGRKSNSRRNKDGHRHNVDDLENEMLAPSRGPSPAVLPTARLKRTTGLADLRRWDPQVTTPRDAVGRPARVVHKTATRSSKPARGMASPVRQNNFLTKPASFRFEAGGKTIPVCARRKTRKEVLHALKQTRSGKGSPKKRNRWSDIRC